MLLATGARYATRRAVQRSNLGQRTSVGSKRNVLRKHVASPTFSPVRFYAKKMTKKRDVYEILGLNKSADTKHVKRAYYELAKVWHPDTNKSPDAKEKFEEIAAAYKVLADEESRRLYDLYGWSGVKSDDGDMSDSDMEKLFKEQFGYNMSLLFQKKDKRRGDAVKGVRKRGKNIVQQLELSFEDAVLGCETSVNYDSIRNCPSCLGTGAKPNTPVEDCTVCDGTGHVEQDGKSILCTNCSGDGIIIADPCLECGGAGHTSKYTNRTVKIVSPPGVRHGQVLRLKGEGNVGSVGGEPGHLLLQVRIKKHDVFWRENENLHINVPVTMSQAILGDQVTVPTLEEPISITLPPGLQSGEQYIIRKKGVPNAANTQRGHQIVTFHIVVPKELTENQKKLMEEFKKDEKPVKRGDVKFTHPQQKVKSHIQSIFYWDAKKKMRESAEEVHQRRTWDVILKEAVANKVKSSFTPKGKKKKTKKS